MGEEESRRKGLVKMITRDLASKILLRLQVYYPRYYVNWNDEKCKIFVDDLVKELAPFCEEQVCRAYREWHEEKNTPPTTADILKKCRALSNLYQKIPELEFEFWTDDKGYEYVRVKN